jgi:hypothetical protein
MAREDDMDQQEKEARIIAYASQEQEKRDTASLDYLMADERGRWFLMRLMDRCHIMDSTFPDSDHTNRMLIAEGERRAALTVRQNIMHMADGLARYQQAEREYMAFQQRMEDLMQTTESEDHHERPVF